MVRGHGPSRIPTRVPRAVGAPFAHATICICCASWCRYLSHAAAEGEQRPIEQHAEVEIMLEIAPIPALTLARHLSPKPTPNGEQVEIMLEAFATQLEDLLDRVGGLRETVAAHSPSPSPSA